VIDAVWRIESAKLTAGLARIVRDVATEELAQDALPQHSNGGGDRRPGRVLR